MSAAPPSIARRPGRLQSLGLALSCVRWDEVLVLQGSPLLGAAFSIGALTAKKALEVAVLAAGSCCLVAYVFVLNDWSGAHADLRDDNRTETVFHAKAVGAGAMVRLFIALLVLGLLSLGQFGPQTLAIAAAIAIAGALYSAPRFAWKGVPLFNSALHLSGGLLHFLLGYSVFRAIDLRGAAIAAYFAQIFAAGHLTHEARDFDSDLRNGIRTNAVTFGRTRVFAAALALFAIGDLLLVLLAVTGTVPRVLTLAGGLYLLQLHWSLRTLRAGLTFGNIRRLQLRYRALYAAMGLIMVAAILLENWS